MTDTTLVQRLREAEANSQQRVLGSRIFGEAADRIEADAATVSRLSAELTEARAETKKQMHRATNAEYMALAYRNMLGPIGSKVARMWDEKHVNRVHFDWGPDARKLDGEQRAQFILDIEKSPSRPADASEIDGPDEASSFLASKEASQ